MAMTSRSRRVSKPVDYSAVDNAFSDEDDFADFTPPLKKKKDSSSKESDKENVTSASADTATSKRRSSPSKRLSAEERKFQRELELALELSSKAGEKEDFAGFQKEREEKKEEDLELFSPLKDEVITAEVHPSPPDRKEQQEGKERRASREGGHAVEGEITSCPVPSPLKTKNVQTQSLSKTRIQTKTHNEVQKRNKKVNFVEDDDSDESSRDSDSEDPETESDFECDSEDSDFCPSPKKKPKEAPAKPKPSRGKEPPRRKPLGRLKQGVALGSSSANAERGSGKGRNVASSCTASEAVETQHSVTNIPISTSISTTSKSTSPESISIPKPTSPKSTSTKSFSTPKSTPTPKTASTPKTTTPKSTSIPKSTKATPVLKSITPSPKPVPSTPRASTGLVNSPFRCPATGASPKSVCSVPPRIGLRLGLSRRGFVKPLHPNASGN